MRITALMTPVLFVAVAGLAACGGDDDAGTEAVERAIEQAGGGEVDIDIDDESGSYRVETDEGTVSMSSSGDLPDDWPADVPLPDGFAITGGSSIDGGSSGRIVAVSGTVAMPLADLDAFYANALSTWTEALRATSDSGDGMLLNVTYQRDGQTLAVGGIDRDGQIEVTFSYTYDPDQDAATPPSADAGTAVDAGDLGIDGVDEALDAVGPEGVASALVSALDADRYEIVDGTIHVHLGDGSRYEPMVACIAATAVVADDPVVIHDASGASTAC